MSEETRAKLSAAFKGRWVGRKVSDETRAKISAAHKGRKHSAEQCAEMSARRLGRVVTEEEIRHAVETHDTKKEAAASLGMTYQTLLKHVKTKNIDGVPEGGKWTANRRAERSQRLLGRVITEDDIRHALAAHDTKKAAADSLEMNYNTFYTRVRNLSRS